MAEITFQDVLNQPIAFHRIFSQIAGSVTAGVFLSQAFYWSKKTKDGWFYKTQNDWSDETTLTRTEQQTARKKLIAIGVLEEKKVGMPAKLYFRVNFSQLESLSLQYAGILQTRMQKPCEQDYSIPANKDAGIPQPFKGTETTTETKTEKKKRIVSDKPKPKPKTSDLTDEQKQTFNAAIDFLKLKLGKFPDAAAQGKALKWMLQNGADLVQIKKGLERQITEYQGRYRASYLTLQKDIFRWIQEGNGEIKDGSNKPNYQNGNGKRTDEQVFQESADFYANFPNQ